MEGVEQHITLQNAFDCATILIRTVFFFSSWQMSQLLVDVAASVTSFFIKGNARFERLAQLRAQEGFISLRQVKLSSTSALMEILRYA